MDTFTKQNKRKSAREQQKQFEQNEMKKMTLGDVIPIVMSCKELANNVSLFNELEKYILEHNRMKYAPILKPDGWWFIFKYKKPTSREEDGKKVTYYKEIIVGYFKLAINNNRWTICQFGQTSGEMSSFMLKFLGVYCTMNKIDEDIYIYSTPDQALNVIYEKEKFVKAGATEKIIFYKRHSMKY